MTAKEFSDVVRHGRKTKEMTAGEIASALRAAGAHLPTTTGPESVLAPAGPGGLYTEHDVAIYPDVRAAGCNPAGLTVAQVGAGWRLLVREEIVKRRRLLGDDRHGLEKWENFWDSTGWNGNAAGATYRTKKPPGFYLPDFEYEVRKIAKERPAEPAPAGAKYVHTFVCHACPRTCTMETEAAVPYFHEVPVNMGCPFRRPEFLAFWKAGPVHTLTP